MYRTPAKARTLTPAKSMGLLSRRVFWIQLIGILEQCAKIQVEVDTENDIALGALNEKREKVTGRCHNSVATVYYGVATWSCELQRAAKNLKIVVWVDGVQRTFRGAETTFEGFAVETGSMPNRDVVLSLTDNSVRFQPHLDHPIVPPFSIPSQALGPLPQLLKYIVELNLDQALGEQPTRVLSQGFQIDPAHLQDPRTLVQTARRIAQDLDDQRLSDILEHIN